MKPTRVRIHDFQEQWFETLLFAGVGAVVLLLLTLPAFNAYFFAENFHYLRMYRMNENSFWRTVFSPISGVFFRPMLVAVTIVFDLLVPPNPVLYHFRNYCLTVFCLIVFHRILLCLVKTRPVRAIVFFLFVVSKIHLTTIGYINLIDELILVASSLLTMLFLIRYLGGSRVPDYVAMFVFFVLTVFSKDYGVAILAPVTVGIALACIDSAPNGKKFDLSFRFGSQVAPLVVVSIFYVALRLSIMGPPPTANAVYSPVFSLTVALTRLAMFTSLIGNLSLGANWPSGVRGLSDWIGRWIGSQRLGQGLELIQYVGVLALLTVTFWRGRSAGRLLGVPLILIAAVLMPLFLTRNLQIYYFLLPLAALAVAIGACLNVASQLRTLWLAVVLIAGVNAAISNYRPAYAWLSCSNEAERVMTSLQSTKATGVLESITFVTPRLDFWQFTLSETMLQEVLKRPGLRVMFVNDRGSLKRSPDERNAIIELD